MSGRLPNPFSACRAFRRAAFFYFLPAALVLLRLPPAAGPRALGAAPAALVGAAAWAGAWAAALLGPVHSLAGATEYVQSPANPVTGAVGAPLAVAFTIVGSPIPPKSFRVRGELPPGLAFAPPGVVDGFVNTRNPAVSGRPTTPGDYALLVQGYSEENGGGHTNNLPQEIRFRILAATVAGAPEIVAAPASLALNAGDRLVWSVAATGDPAPTFQWRRNGTDLPGATGAQFALARVTAAEAGDYTVRVTNTAGAVTSPPATLTVGRGLARRAANLSVRVRLGGAQPLTAGFVLEGPAASTVLVRGLGPALAAFGVADALRGPRLAVFSATGARLAENDDWPAALAPTFAEVGAFALPAGSGDAALVATLPPGAYTAQLTAPEAADASGGEALIEVYVLP